MLARFNPKASVFGTAGLFLTWMSCAIAGLVAAPELTQNGSRLNHYRAPFAIGDLDGDEMPDLAVVQIVGYGSAKNNYSIRLEFNGRAGAAVGIEAPFGGLRIDSRDVNGDHRNDLILSTLAESEVVAVLVNEGDGNFVVAKPSLFPNLERNQMRVVRAFGAQMGDERTLLQSRAAFGEETIGATGRNPGAGSYLLPEIRGSELSQRPTHANRGRSPPAVVSA